MTSEIPDQEALKDALWRRQELLSDPKGIREWLNREFTHFELLGSLERQFQPSFMTTPPEAIITMNKEGHKVSGRLVNWGGILNLYRSYEDLISNKPRAGCLCIKSGWELQNPEFDIPTLTARLGRLAIDTPIIVSTSWRRREGEKLNYVVIGQKTADQEHFNIFRNRLLDFRIIINDQGQPIWQVWKYPGCRYQVPSQEEQKKLELQQSPGILRISATTDFPEAAGFKLEIPIWALPTKSQAEQAGLLDLSSVPQSIL